MPVYNAPSLAREASEGLRDSSGSERTVGGLVKEDRFAMVGGGVGRTERYVETGYSLLGSGGGSREYGEMKGSGLVSEKDKNVLYDSLKPQKDVRV